MQALFSNFLKFFSTRKFYEGWFINLPGFINLPDNTLLTGDVFFLILIGVI